MLAAGCAEGPIKADPAVVSEHRSRFLLKEEPSGAVTPIAWREAQQENPPEGGAPAPEPDDSTHEVVLVGRIGGMPNPWPDAESAYPWREDQATFFLVDPATAAEFEAHAEEQGDDHAADCPFCAREAANQVSAVVAVTFNDAQGEPIAIDARELLGLTAGETVVVQGRLSKVLGGDFLVLKADGLFARN